MNFKKWVKSIQTAGYNGARTVCTIRWHHKISTLASTSMELQLNFYRILSFSFLKSDIFFNSEKSFEKGFCPDVLVFAKRPDPALYIKKEEAVIEFVTGNKFFCNEFLFIVITQPDEKWVNAFVCLYFFLFHSILFIKVQVFWEGQKDWKKSPTWFDITE